MVLGLGWTLNPATGILLRGRGGGSETEMQLSGHPMMTGQRQEGCGHWPGMPGAPGAAGGGKEPPAASVGSGLHVHFALGGCQLVLVCRAAPGGQRVDTHPPGPPPF